MILFWLSNKKKKKNLIIQTFGDVHRALTWPKPPQRWHDSPSRGFLLASSVVSPKIVRVQKKKKLQKVKEISQTILNVGHFPL
jgi:hypothetical protein